MIMISEETQEKVSHLVKRAMGDKKLQKSLLNSPSQFLRENGIEISADLEVTVATDKDSLSVRIQPQNSAANEAELTDDALEGVLGGAGSGKVYLVFTFKLVAVK
jgi:hypothetical protein